MIINVSRCEDDNKSVGSSYIVPLPVYYMLHRHLTHRPIHPNRPFLGVVDLFGAVDLFQTLRGMVNRTSVPVPSVLSISIVPWWASTTLFTIAMPRPVPPPGLEE